MRIIRICCGPYDSLAYLLTEGDEGILVDVGPPGDSLLRAIEEEGVDLKFVLITHGHYDHLTGLRQLQDLTGVRAYAHPIEVEFFREVWPLSVEPPELEPLPKRVSFGGIEVEVIHTPGHTPGSVCYFIRRERILFTGDTLFSGAVGRTDFKGGSKKRLRESLRYLLRLGPDVRVLPGHGEPTTLGREEPLIKSL